LRCSGRCCTETKGRQEGTTDASISAPGGARLSKTFALRSQATCESVRLVAPVGPGSCYYKTPSMTAAGRVQTAVVANVGTHPNPASSCSPTTTSDLPFGLHVTPNSSRNHPSKGSIHERGKAYRWTAGMRYHGASSEVLAATTPPTARVDNAEGPEARETAAQSAVPASALPARQILCLLDALWDSQPYRLEHVVTLLATRTAAESLHCARCGDSPRCRRDGMLDRHSIAAAWSKIQAYLELRPSPLPVLPFHRALKAPPALAAGSGARMARGCRTGAATRGRRSSISYCPVRGTVLEDDKGALTGATAIQAGGTRAAAR
jgi:hypothetical protein